MPESIFASLRRFTRFGPDDELGTLNHVTPDVRRNAAASLSRARTGRNPPPNLGSENPSDIPPAPENRSISFS